MASVLPTSSSDLFLGLIKHATVGYNIAVSVDAKVTELLIRFTQGDRNVEDELFGAVYHELRRLARSFMARERPGQTLQATALVHEAYLRLIDQNRVQWRNRGHFLAVAAQQMRRILVDQYRIKIAKKRGGTQIRVTLNELHSAPEDGPDLVRLDDALTRLAELDPRPAKIVELRYFGGLGNEEIAEVLGISIATLKREWTLARAWLYRELKDA